jgi:hypothetical protein
MSQQIFPRPTMLDRTCHLCGSDRAWHGLTLPRGKLWFCSVHKETGEMLFAPTGTTKVDGE